MADNFQVPGGTGPNISTRDVGGIHHPRSIVELRNPSTGGIDEDAPSYGTIYRPSASYSGAIYAPAQLVTGKHRGAVASIWVTGVPGGGGSSNNGSLDVSLYAQSVTGSWLYICPIQITAPAEYSLALYPGIATVTTGNTRSLNAPPTAKFGVYAVGSNPASTGWVYTLGVDLVH
jgi:hypothetical protein